MFNVLCECLVYLYIVIIIINIFTFLLFSCH